MEKKLEEKFEVHKFPKREVKIPVQYRGYHVIVVGNEIAASGKTKEEAVKNYDGERDFLCIYMRTDEEMKELYKRAASNTFGISELG